MQLNALIDQAHWLEKRDKILRQDFNSQLFGISQQQRAAFRKAVLSVTVDDLKRVTKKYLSDSNDTSQALMTYRAADEETQQALIKQGFETFTL